ncbi:MAG: YkvI family membrane protein [Anaerovoracaceae bacterium]
MKQNKGITFIGVALMYVGTIMGAGFASGREIWQFFIVFKGFGILGIIFVSIMFMLIGLASAYIARKINSNDYGRVIVPGGNKKLESAIGYFMAFILFSVIITMSAAGGALFQQQFGQSKILGGAVIILLVIVTIIGGFHRVEKVFRVMMPVLLIAIMTVCIYSIATSEVQIQEAYGTPSPLTRNWILSAFLYLSYNILGVVPIMATAGINAKSEKHAYFGAALGGLFLGVIAMSIGLTLATQPADSLAVEMPMLFYAGNISPIIGTIYSIVLMLAIYASATANFYGFSTKIKEGKYKNLKVIIFAWLGFAIGLMGFSNVIDYMFPIEGFLGLGIIVLLAINFFNYKLKN